MVFTRGKRGGVVEGKRRLRYGEGRKFDLGHGYTIVFFTSYLKLLLVMKNKKII